MKKLFGCLLAVSLLFSLSACFDDDSVPQEEIEAYVQEHQTQLTALLQLPKDTLRQEGDESAFLRQQLGWNTIVKKVRPCGYSVTEFYCGGKGFGGNSTYVGFYFSPSDTPHDLDHGFSFTEMSPGIYQWRSDDQSDAYMTCRITPCWFYYILEIY